MRTKLNYIQNCPVLFVKVNFIENDVVSKSENQFKYMTF